MPANLAQEPNKQALSERLDRVAEELVRLHPEQPPARVRQLVVSSATSLDGAKITEFVPILVQREVEGALRDSAA